MNGKTRLDSHDIAVVHESAPEARSDNGYRYRFGIMHGDEEYHPLVVCHIRERWAGNFWREAERFPEPPECVKKEVVKALPYNRGELNFDEGCDG